MSRALAAKIVAHALLIRREHNNKVPIHKLPREIFSYVIHKSLQDRASRIKELEGYAMVCSRRTTINSNPILWSVISTVDLPAAVTKALERSRPVPLDIQISEWTGADVTRGGERILNPSVVDVCKAAGRWSSADLHVGWRSLDDLKVLERSEAPRLETLRLKVQTRYYTLPRPFFNLFDAGRLAAHLKVLHVSGIKVPLQLLHTLYDLELDDAWLSQVELLSLVRSNSSLRRLSLSGVSLERCSHTTRKYGIRQIRDKFNSPAVYLFPHLVLPRLNRHCVSARARLAPRLRWGWKVQGR